MTEAQLWLVRLLAAQHIGTDSTETADAYLNELVEDPPYQAIPAMPDAARLIEQVRRTVPETAIATKALQDAIIRAAKRSNCHDSTLPFEDLVEKIEVREQITWNGLLSLEGLRMLEAYRAKRRWTRQRYGYAS